nr:Stk1 family PASTA domain-containing Ser/Thr kinase [Microbacterium thalassium]
MIGRLVDGRYRVRARIARGGMATVYVATDLRLERRVALKVMHGHLSDDTVFQSRFIQEARAAARLADPNVVNVFDQGQDGEVAYLVMEYLPGITLRELLREQKRLTVPQAISIMDAVVSGLAAAHRSGIVHRDVKPENVLLAEDGRVKIGDFGLARATSANTATGAQLLGTIAYLAPELVTRGTADARSDIYALGIMLYEMLVGEQPYKGEQPMQIAYQHATDSVPRPSVKNPSVPEPVDELVLWATEKQPEDRPADAREMLRRLRDIESELGITPQIARTGPIGVVTEGIATDDLTAVIPPTPTGPIVMEQENDNAGLLRRATRRRSGRGGWIVAFVLMLAAVAAGVGWWFGSGPGSLIAVPDVAGESYEEAAAALEEDGLVAVQAGRNSLEVDEGLAIETQPAAGDRVEKDATVTVFVSLGPADVQFAALNGQSEDDVTALLAEKSIDVDETLTYYTDGESGEVVYVVIHPASGADDVECGDGCTVREGDSATLGVSLGPLTDVVGMTADEAVKTLDDLGIEVTSQSEEYSSDIEAGSVISMAPRSSAGWWRPGDTASLVVSKGPAPIEVPDVRGDSITDAIDELRGAGFSVNTDALPLQLFWGLYDVTAIDPAPGTYLAPGSQVSITGFELS